jgi:hypothetical protein
MATDNQGVTMATLVADEEPAMPRADPQADERAAEAANARLQAQDRFLVRQHFTVMVNRYDIVTWPAGGKPGEVVATGSAPSTPSCRFRRPARSSAAVSRRQHSPRQAARFALLVVWCLADLGIAFVTLNRRG